MLPTRSPRKCAGSDRRRGRPSTSFGRRSLLATNGFLCPDVSCRTIQGPGTATNSDIQSLETLLVLSGLPHQTPAFGCRPQMRKDPDGSWYVTGADGNGKLPVLYAQYREPVTAGRVRCHVRTTRELVEELRRAEFDED